MMPRWVLVAMLLSAGMLRAETNTPDRCVRFVYLVSADREVTEAYRLAMENAARDIQGWYARQLGGATFRLHSPVVDVVRSDKKARWFTTNANGRLRDNWGFRNTLAEMQRLRDVKPNRDAYVWIVYSDGPGNKGRAIPGFAYLPEDDLLGLVGKHPTQKDPKRWIGGLGHELGHALGLAHPADTKKDAEALMWAGFYGHYPNGCYLTEDDKRTLRANPMIVAQTPHAPSVQD